MLTQTAMEDFKDFLDNVIAFAKVTVNGTVRRAGCGVYGDYAAAEHESDNHARTAVQQK